MTQIFTKKLSITEIKRHVIFVPAIFVNEFPDVNSNFKIKIGDKLLYTYIDVYNRLRLGSRIFEKLELEKVGSQISIEKESNGDFVIKKIAIF